jgi:hypothetical protein
MRRIDYHTKRELAIFTVVFLTLEFVFGMAYILPAHFCKNCDSEQMKEIGCGILIAAPLANMLYIDIRIIIELIRNRNKK